MAIKISAELAHTCALEEIPRHADALESLGYHRVWVPDTIVSAWEAWLAAGTIVQRTRRIKIGLGVINPYTHHPVAMAQMAATMQHLSQGRLALSIGKGIPRFLEKAGIEQKASAVEECMIVLRGLLKGGRTSLNGDAFRVDGMRLRTAPLAVPVPLYAAAAGPAGWEAALRTADGVATFWHAGIAATVKQALSMRELPIAALIPFSLTESAFPEDWKGLSAPDELRERVKQMEKQGIDEVIVAYRELEDLNMAAELIGA